MNETDKLKVEIYDDVVKEKNKEYIELTCRFREICNDIKNKDKEIERLNNIINEFDKWLDVNLTNLEKEEASNIYNEGLKQGMLSNGRLIKNKLQELKGSDKE